MFYSWFLTQYLAGYNSIVLLCFIFRRVMLLMCLDTLHLCCVTAQPTQQCSMQFYFRLSPVPAPGTSVSTFLSAVSGSSSQSPGNRRVMSLPPSCGAESVRVDAPPEGGERSGPLPGNCILDVPGIGRGGEQQHDKVDGVSGHLQWHGRHQAPGFQ